MEIVYGVETWTTPTLCSPFQFSTNPAMNCTARWVNTGATYAGQQLWVAAFPLTSTGSGSVVSVNTSTDTDDLRNSVRNDLRVIAQQRRNAQVRAQSLLVAHLDPANQRRLDFDECIEITGSDGHHYRIEAHRYVGNVVQLDQHGHVQSRWCAHPRDEQMPLADHLLAQMLALQTDADQFLAIANRHA